MQRCGVNIKPKLFLPRILFLSPHCHLDEELRKRKELVSYEDMEMFLHSLREGYVTWITDAMTPSWISGQRVIYRVLYKSRSCHESTVARQLENVDAEWKVAKD